MDDEHIKTLLSACRPGGEDDVDPAFAEALKHARADDDLQQWLENEKTGDRAIRQTLQSIPVPADLKARLLAAEPAQTKPLAEPAPRAHTTSAGFPGSPRRLGVDWKTAAWALAAAASIALVFYVAWPRKPVRSFDRIVAAAVGSAASPGELAHYSESSLELIRWLTTKKAPIPGDLPPSLASLPAVGCSELEWDGVAASLITLRLNTGANDGINLQLFTVHRSSCSGGVFGSKPVVTSRRSQAIATWEGRDTVCILVSSLLPDALRRLLLGTPAGVARSGEVIDSRRRIAMSRFIDRLSRIDDTRS